MLTPRELNRATLARQLLLRREPLDVVEAVKKILALQAQEPASPYLALWNRLEGFDPTELDVALAGNDAVKATLLRITLHLVAAADHEVVHAAMQPTLRAARLGDPRFTVSGLSAEEADALVPELLDFAHQPRTVAEITAWLDRRLDTPADVAEAGRAVWWAMRSFAPLRHAPTGGPWSFGARPSFQAAGIPPASADRDVADEALAVLIPRYLRAFGPASVADVAQFALVQRGRVRAALARCSDELERLEGHDGTELLDVLGAPRPAQDTPAPPRLLGMWDSVLLAHHDRSRILPSDLRKLVIRRNGDVLPTLLVDGSVAGVWRPVDRGIEATAFRPLHGEDWDGLAREAGALSTFLADRDPQVYRRYGRWWDDLPAAEVRVLG